MKEEYKIAEVAKIFNISRQTLLFYHKKEILIPHIIDENTGYRYYSKEQIWDLFFILTLKKAGLSLEEIKTYVELNNTEEGISFLENKVEEIDKKIEELKKSKEKIIRKINDAKYTEKGIEEKIGFANRRSMKWYKLKQKDVNDQVELAVSYEKIKKIAKENNINEIVYVMMIDINNKEVFKTNTPIKYSGILIPEGVDIEGCEVLELGEVIVTKSGTSYEKLSDSYKKILDYLEENQINHRGYGIEVSTESLFSTEDGIGGVFEIIIPIEK